MFFVNLVRLLLLVGVLWESSVTAGEHKREQPSDLQTTILNVVEQQVEYCKQNDTDTLMTLVHPDIHVMMEGFPPMFGHEGARFMFEFVPEIAARIENTYEEVQPMDEAEEYVYVRLHFDFFNQSGENYKDGNGLFILRKTADGYKFYVMSFNTHNQSSF